MSEDSDSRTESQPKAAVPQVSKPTLIVDRLASMGPQNAVDGIRRPPCWLVIMPNLNLAQKTQRQELHAGNDEDGGEYKQRPVIVHNVHVVHELLEDKP